jgi:cytochrome c peroxidase
MLGQAHRAVWSYLAALCLCACDDTPAANSGTAADAAVAEGEHAHSHGPSAPLPLEAVPDGSVIGDFSWDLPAGFPLPVVPADNPMSTAKVQLGRRLFYDTRLSDNQTFSCATCHKQELAFTDGRATGLGSTGQAHPRGPMSLANVAYAASLTWANPLYAMGVMPDPLARQSELPMYGDAPIELGLHSPAELEERLSSVPEYGQWFAAAFPEDQPLTAANASRALAAFERTLISGRAPYDRFQQGDASALDASAQRGYALFFGEKLECFHCHSGFDFTDHVHYQGKPQIEVHYHNTGLYNLDGRGAYPEPNTGVYSVTGDPKDMGFFKAPTLRNIALTAPYMHDGSVASLSAALAHYAAGGRTIGDGENAGVGSDSPLKDILIGGFSLSDQERTDLIAFVQSLSDDEFLHDPAFSDPWAGAPNTGS